MCSWSVNQCFYFLRKGNFICQSGLIQLFPMLLWNGTLDQACIAIRLCYFRIMNFLILKAIRKEFQARFSLSMKGNKVFLPLLLLSGFPFHYHFHNSLGHRPIYIFLFSLVRAVLFKSCTIAFRVNFLQCEMLVKWRDGKTLGKPDRDEHSTCRMKLNMHVPVSNMHYFSSFSSSVLCNIACWKYPKGIFQIAIPTKQAIFVKKKHKQIKIKL